MSWDGGVSQKDPDAFERLASHLDRMHTEGGCASMQPGVVELRPGVRLTAEPGTPTTVDGEPGTAYVWSPVEAPWLRAEFVLDERNQLRSAKVTDTTNGDVIAEMSARPTDAQIQRPTWTVP